MKLKKLTITAIFVALGVLSAHLIYIPAGAAKCFPVQHAINVLLAVLLGARYSTAAAFGTALLRNLLGTGSIFAFPGSIFGAALAGILYQRTKSIYGAVFGEIIGTGIIGALAAYPMAKFLLGSEAGAFFFVGPFFISTFGGSLIAFFICRTSLRRIVDEYIK